MRCVLITGGLGFVGSHLADALLEQGCIVTLVDNLQSNTARPEEYQGRCQVFTQSIEEVAPTLQSTAFAFHEIYHLASVVGPAGVLRHAGDIAGSVARGTETVVQLALQHKAKLLVTSTSEVYGQSGRLTETLPCIVGCHYTVRLEYAAAKLTSEISVLNKARVSDLRVNVVRPFNIAGPRQLPEGGFVLPRFVTAALNDAPLTVFGDGLQSRAFTDVRDIVTGLVAVMRHERTGLLLNLGNPKNEVSMLRLAEEVKRLARSSSPIVHVDPKELFGPLYEEGIERVPDVTKALGSLDWQPHVSLKRTILDTLDYYRGRPDLLGNGKLTGPGHRLAI